MTAGSVVGVAHTGITVSNMGRALRFFSEVLGGTTTSPTFYDDSIFERITGVAGAHINIAYVELPGHKLELLEYKRPSDKIAAELRPCDPGHLHLSLLVEGIEAVAERMCKAGFEPAGPIQHVSEGEGFKVIYTYGFDNLVIELMDFSSVA